MSSAKQQSNPQPGLRSPSGSTIEAVGNGIARTFAAVDQNAEIEALLEELGERLEAGGMTADEQIARGKH